MGWIGRHLPVTGSTRTVGRLKVGARALLNAGVLAAPVGPKNYVHTFALPSRVKLDRAFPSGRRGRPGILTPDGYSGRGRAHSGAEFPEVDDSVKPRLVGVIVVGSVNQANLDITERLAELGLDCDVRFQEAVSVEGNRKGQA